MKKLWMAWLSVGCFICFSGGTVALPLDLIEFTPDQGAIRNNGIDPAFGHGFDEVLASGTTTSNIDQTTASPVPEAGTLVLLGFGMIGLAAFGRRRSLFKNTSSHRNKNRSIIILHSSRTMPRKLSA